MELGASKRTAPAEPLSRTSKNESNESGTHTGLVDATVYDFERLERAVASLVEQHDRLKLENAALRDDAELNAARIGELESKLKAAEDRRQGVLGRIDALMSEFDKLDALPHDSQSA